MKKIEFACSVSLERFFNSIFRFSSSSFHAGKKKRTFILHVFQQQRAAETVCLSTLPLTFKTLFLRAGEKCTAARALIFPPSEGYL